MRTYPFKQDRHNCMKRKVNEPLGSRKWLAVTNDGRTDHQPCRKIEIFQFKQMSEHALGLCSDLKPFVRGQVDGHVVYRADIWRKGYRDSKT